MISVIIPAFNAEKYIKRCIDSVLKQTYKDLEIIIVDDGSYDNTPLICDEYSIKHKNFKVFHIENSGVSAARNYGLTQASGEYITFLDADDWIETNCFAEMSKYNTDIIAAGMIFDFGNGKTIKLEGKAGSYSQENFFKNFLLGHTDVHVVNKLFAKRILNGIFFDSSVRVSEDCLFLCRAIINADSIYVLNKSFYHYYQNPYSVMHESFSKKNFDKLKVASSITDIASKKYGSLASYAYTMKISTECRLYGELYESNKYLDYKDLFDKLRYDIKTFNIRKYRHYLSKKHLIAIILAKIHPWLYSRLRKNPNMRFR